MGYGIQTSDSKGKHGFFHNGKTQHFQGYWGVYPQSCPAQPLLQPIDFSAFSNLFESRSPMGEGTPELRSERATLSLSLGERDRVRGANSVHSANRPTAG
jgi:hypothetical protein